MDRATSLGMKALALTDHGNLYGTIEFYNQAKAKGINPHIDRSYALEEAKQALKDISARRIKGKAIVTFGAV